ncbi:CehA/McbA family metallohydrolase [Alteromonas sp. S015]|uniref:CehA/McbA family metallohydrolase n=1 Tax=Alteromonas sp. S015 TaxID=3117401 RepID=UPI002FE2AD1A
MQKTSLNSLLLFTFTFLSNTVFAPVSFASVSIEKGITSIPHGNASAPNDLTIKNDKLAFSISIGSAPPWGVAPGCIVDIANVLPDGSLSNDRVAFADFIPNAWSSWPNTYHNVEIIKDSNDEAIVNITRDFSDVTINTQYTLTSGSDLIQVSTTMTNSGDSAVTLTSGYTLWPDSGFKFGVPKFENREKQQSKKASSSASNKWMSDRFVGYNEDWAIALHAPYMNEAHNQSRDLYAKHSLKSNESITFSGAYQVLSSGDLAPVMAAEIAREKMIKGTISGTISSASGKHVTSAAVVVHKDNVPYMWGLAEKGNYKFDLPVGEYEVYATGKHYSDSPTHTITITENETTSLSFNELEEPGTVSLKVTDENNKSPLDAKITIAKGKQPLIQYLGAPSFFTELNNKGHAEFTLAPGNYQLRVSYGDEFNASAQLVSAKVLARETIMLNTAIDVMTYPTLKGWYSADLHHHADVLEGSTSPEYLVRSQLASGLDVLFVSDHDSTKNNKAIQILADKRAVPFIPSIEISPSWGHFNAFPIDEGAELSIDPGKDDIHSIIEDARRMGATVIASNHPFIPYGYFSSLGKGTAPGGFNPTIDLLEINAVVPNEPTLNKAYALWSEGLPYYLTAGSDTHDVLNETSGLNRMFAHTVDKPSAKSYADALKSGKAYVSFGPIMYPQNFMFGDTLKLAQRHSQSIALDVAAVNGLKNIKLIGSTFIDEKSETPEGASIIEQRDLTGKHKTVTFSLPMMSGWVAIELEDMKGRKAYSNPIWLKMVEENQF